MESKLLIVARKEYKYWKNICKSEPDIVYYKEDHFVEYEDIDFDKFDDCVTRVDFIFGVPDGVFQRSCILTFDDVATKSYFLRWDSCDEY